MSGLVDVVVSDLDLAEKTCLTNIELSDGYLNQLLRYLRAEESTLRLFGLKALLVATPSFTSAQSHFFTDFSLSVLAMLSAEEVS